MKKLLITLLLLPALALAAEIHYKDGTTFVPVNKGNPLPTMEHIDAQLRIAQGQVPSILHINKFGLNTDVDAAEDIWDGGGNYTPPTANRTHQIASTSAQDAGSVISTGTISSNTETTMIDTSGTFVTDSVAAGDIVLDDTSQDHTLVVSVDSETQLTVEPWHHWHDANQDTDYSGGSYRIVETTGTGAAVFHIKAGIAKNGVETTEFVVLNGTSNVATANTYYRIDRAHLHGVGSNGSNVGTITATADTDATVTAQINAGQGQTQMAFKHIPNGQTAYIAKWCASLFRSGAAAQAMARLSLRSRLWGDDADGELLRSVMGISVDGGLSCVEFNPYLRIRHNEDVWIRADAVSDTNSQITGNIELIVVDN